MVYQLNWRKTIVLTLVVAFFAYLLPMTEAHANIGEFEYDDSGLTRTENDGVGNGNEEDDGGWFGWWDDFKEGAGDVVDDVGDFFQPAVDAVDSAWDWTGEKISQWWDWTTQKVSEGWESTKNAWNDFTEWTSDVWANTPDWVKSSLAFVGIAAVVVGVAVVGIISAPVAIAAIVGAGIAGGLYYALNGGSESYSFLGALGWTAGGALLGGVGQATGALAAGANSLRIFAGRQLAGMRLAFTLNRFASGSGLRAGLQVARGLGAAWLKIGGPAAGITFGSHALNYILTGNIDYGEMVFDTGLAFATAPLGFGLTKGILNSFRTVRTVAAPIAGSVALGGFSNVAMQSFKGDATAMDFLIGSAVGLTFVLPDSLVTKFVNNSAASNTYEFVKKQLSDLLSNNLEKKVGPTNNK
ncbi:hypothetical protein [Bacillus sp. Marseille-Q3570]|uniref:hypothetical protein n=1 Tax=Bacillus sp. Marseille-Q3570 TaxID=2963522 RepID=UPI0021B77DF7|nr:hypothetical protein [Bacillus sp. Marseille-Q3570]